MSDSEHGQVLLKLGNIEGKLDRFIKNFDDHIEDDQNTHGHMHKRLGRLEISFSKIAGIVLTIGSIAGIITSAIISWYHKSGGSG